MKVQTRVRGRTVILVSFKNEATPGDTDYFVLAYGDKAPVHTSFLSYAWKLYYDRQRTIIQNPQSHI